MFLCRHHGRPHRPGALCLRCLAATRRHSLLLYLGVTATVSVVMQCTIGDALNWSW